VAAETGLAGLAAYAGLMATAVVWTWSRLRQAAHSQQETDRWNAAVLTGVLGVLVHLSVHNIVDNLFVQGMVLLVGLWLTAVHTDRTSPTESTGVLR
jgi:hypothetical protein